DALAGHPGYQGLVQALEEGRPRGELTLLNGTKPFLLAALRHHLRRPLLVITAHPEDARRLHSQLQIYLGDDVPVLLLPEPEVLPFERLVADATTNRQRLEVLAALAGIGEELADSVEPVVVASLAGALHQVPNPTSFREACQTLCLGQQVGLELLMQHLVRLGYRVEEAVEIPGTVSRRGGIVDIFPPNASLPTRIELLGDRVESLRLFEPASQRSVAAAQAVTLIPSQEVLPALTEQNTLTDLIGRLNFSACPQATRERMEEELAMLLAGHQIEDLPFYRGFFNHASLVDYLPSEGTLALDRPSLLAEEARRLEEQARDLREARIERGELPGNFPGPLMGWEVFQERFKGRRRLELDSWTSDGVGGMGFLPAPSYNGRVDYFTTEAAQMLREGHRLVVLSRHSQRLAELLGQEGVGVSVLQGLDTPPSGPGLLFLHRSLREGWTLPLEDGWLTLLTDTELFGTTRVERPRPRTPVPRGVFLSELIPGSYVVHVDHGIARFAGTRRMRSQEGEHEYLVLEYAEGDRLYVPTEHLDRVSPYLAPGDQPPSLTRLGTQEWARAKERVQRSTREMAQELLDLYAARGVAQGHALSPDSPWQEELEDAFSFEETADQARTIAEVKADLEQPRPMDRLVCGDVGYGKTEVALRAAFKAVLDGFQAALLVPTTVLAQQHYATFSERLSPFPVRVEVLSRFRSPREQNEVVRGLTEGSVDIVIGTHRLLQRDVRFKNLGLVLVDEEQRFGVAHKERLKQMRREVDVLTLSATPIPRTLYMALSGIRDMSTMETPPEERLPVKTHVSEYSDEVVKEAILRELDRGGQVFLVHNRVHTIREAAARVQYLVPQARVAVAHGQMPEEELENTMLAFTSGQVDVLVCTTIIESGLDIPNANTLIVDRADRFGLSQLYQLRGRVGRGAHRAYAYLLVPRGRRVTEAAEKRLRAILEASELGSGFRIAMRDLEIRGGGNILGREQSGHIHAVGFELYTQLLSQAVEELRAQQQAEEGRPVEPRGLALRGPQDVAAASVRVDLPLAAYIPEDYIPHLPTRLAIYQRLTRVHQREEARALEEELRDRFGPLPEPVSNLLYVVELKALAATAGVESLVRDSAWLVLGLTESVGSARLALEKALGPLARVGNQQVRLDLRRMGRGWMPGLVALLDRLKSATERLKELAQP
ncbi:MAG: transcription-repair coupling factor, partial [Dehalococcoidia bacterium]